MKAWFASYQAKKAEYIYVILDYLIKFRQKTTNFLRSDRKGLWDSHLHAIEQIGILCVFELYYVFGNFVACDISKRKTHNYFINGARVEARHFK